MSDVERSASATAPGDEWRDDLPGDIRMRSGLKARHDDTSAHSVFLAWERLRVVYNTVLVLLSLALFWRDLDEPMTWEFLIGGALGANVCFSVASCAEGYLFWLGLSRKVARPLIFAAGTLLSVALVSLIRVSMMMRF